MKVLAYVNQFGPAQVYLPPAGKAVPESAWIPEGPFPRASVQVASRGTDISWDRWCRRLAAQLPYFDSWSVEDVPDGLTASEALSLVRQRASEQALGAPVPSSAGNSAD
jgi:hypothetical protein